MLVGKFMSVLWLKSQRLSWMHTMQNCAKWQYSADCKNQVGWEGKGGKHVCNTVRNRDNTVGGSYTRRCHCVTLLPLSSAVDWAHPVGAFWVLTFFPEHTPVIW